jgi:hypothetical protein
VDPRTGRLDPVAFVPGFTRGLDFLGPFAFIGLSQVRESNLFGGLPITEKIPVEERACGMWVVDTRTGQTAAFLRFEAGVREVFAVQVLPGIAFPDLLNEEQDDHIANSFVLPDEAMADVPKEGRSGLRRPAGQPLLQVPGSEVGVGGVPRHVHEPQGLVQLLGVGHGRHGVEPDRLVPGRPGRRQHRLGQLSTQPPAAVPGADVEPLHLPDPRSQRPQGDAPGRPVPVPGDQQAAARRGVRPRQPGQLGGEPLEAHVGREPLGVVRPEQLPDGGHLGGRLRRPDHDVAHSSIRRAADSG